MQRNRFPSQNAVTIARYALRVSPASENGDSQQRGVLSHGRKFCTRQPYMDVLPGGNETSRCECSHELVRSAAEGVGHTSDRAGGKSQTIHVPAFEGRLTKVLEHDVAGPFLAGRFRWRRWIVRLRHPAEDGLGFLIL